MHAQSLQSCLTLCDSMNCSSLGFSVQGFLLTRILEWVAMSSFRGSSQPRDQTCISCISCAAGRFFTAEQPGKAKLLVKYIHNGEKRINLLKRRISIDKCRRNERIGKSPLEYHSNNSRSSISG